MLTAPHTCLALHSPNTATTFILLLWVTSKNVWWNPKPQEPALIMVFYYIRTVSDTKTQTKSQGAFPHDPSLNDWPLSISWHRHLCLARSLPVSRTLSVSTVSSLQEGLILSHWLRKLTSTLFTQASCVHSYTDHLSRTPFLILEDLYLNYSRQRSSPTLQVVASLC